MDRGKKKEKRWLGGGKKRRRRSEQRTLVALRGPSHEEVNLVTHFGGVAKPQVAPEFVDFDACCT